MFFSIRTNYISRVLSVFIAITFILSSVAPIPVARAQPAPTALSGPAPTVALGSVPALPQLGMVGPSEVFIAPSLAGIIIHPENPFQFDFVVDSGDQEFSSDQLRDESTKLIKYFLASLTLPEDELWVNLSPNEPDRIISDAFEQTEMGRDLLAQDYLLKQLTASLIYPEDELGKKFWERVRVKVREQYGNVEIPTNVRHQQGADGEISPNFPEIWRTFNKVWIVPDEVLIHQNKDRAFIVESRLKVMLEDDYLGVVSHQSSVVSQEKSLKTDDWKLMTTVVKEVIIPEIEREVNQGKNFANLRQIYNSFILASWYKENLKGSILSQSYTDQKKMVGLRTGEKGMAEKIYQQYLKAFKTGVYDFIKEEYDAQTRSVIPRRYFSGGVGLTAPHTQQAAFNPTDRAMTVVSVSLQDPQSDRAILEESESQEGRDAKQDKLLDLRTLIKDQVRRNSGIADEKNIEIIVKLPEQKIFVEKKGGELPSNWFELRALGMDVIGELIFNAIKYSHERARITISLHQEDHEALILIRDEGIGIAEEDRKNIWWSEFRAEGAKRVAKGDGKGLSMALQYVQQYYKGTIELTESEEGKGSVFTVRLPIFEESDPAMVVAKKQEKINEQDLVYNSGQSTLQYKGRKLKLIGGDNGNDVFDLEDGRVIRVGSGLSEEKLRVYERMGSEGFTPRILQTGRMNDGYYFTVAEKIYGQNLLEREGDLTDAQIKKIIHMLAWLIDNDIYILDFFKLSNHMIGHKKDESQEDNEGYFVDYDMVFVGVLKDITFTYRLDFNSSSREREFDWNKNGAREEILRFLNDRAKDKFDQAMVNQDLQGKSLAQVEWEEVQQGDLLSGLIDESEDPDFSQMKKLAVGQHGDIYRDREGNFYKVSLGLRQLLEKKKALEEASNKKAVRGFVRHAELKLQQKNETNMREARSLIRVLNLGKEGRVPHIVSVGVTPDGAFWFKFKAIQQAQALNNIPILRKFSTADKINVLIEVARILGRIHEEGYAHGDVKPSNIIVNEEGEVMVVDFSGMALFGDKIKAWTPDYSPAPLLWGPRPPLRLIFLALAGQLIVFLMMRKWLSLMKIGRQADWRTFIRK